MTIQAALPLVFGVAVVMVLLVAIPYYADATLEDMFELQPDMGYGLVSLAILCLVDSLINAAVTSERSIRRRFVTVRDLPPVMLPQTAVQASIVPPVSLYESFITPVRNDELESGLIDESVLEEL